MPETAQTRYARSGELSIAFQEVGVGPPLLLIPGFISHVELQWDLPAWGGLIDRLARFSRLIVFDKRGMGLSDRNLGAGALEDRMDDIRAVLDACDVERAALVGISEGGPLAILFAATYPDASAISRCTPRMRGEADPATAPTRCVRRSKPGGAPA